MKVEQLFEDIMMGTQNYLLEEYKVEKKGNKYLIVGRNGAEPKNYFSLENATNDLMLIAYGNRFKRMPFEKKQEKIKKFMEEWKKKNNVKDHKIRKSGFEQYQ